MTFGERLRYLREEKELRQQDLAEYLNISTRMIGYYESDQHFPSDAQMIIKLAKFFDVSLDYLFGISDIRNNEILDTFNAEFACLSDKNKISAMDYINYLKSKQC
jgi:transcriptional regulator with XRE-family HTH domain